MDLSILGIEPVTAILLTGFVIGFVELAKALYDNEWRKAIVVAIAGIAGGICAPFIGISIITGIVAGFAASGAITLVQNIGGQTVNGITLGQIAEVLAWFAGGIGSITAIGVVISKVFNKALSKNLENSLQPLIDKIDHLEQKVDQLEAKHDNSDMDRLKDFLVDFMARLERGEKVDEEEVERFWENYDNYSEHGGNSYIHGKMEKLKKEGKLQ